MSKIKKQKQLKCPICGYEPNMLMLSMTKEFMDRVVCVCGYIFTEEELK